MMKVYGNLRNYSFPEMSGELNKFINCLESSYCPTAG